MTHGADLSLVKGARVEVLDWHPSAQREKWQKATVEHVDTHEILVRLDDMPGALTAVGLKSRYWRQADPRGAR